MCFIEFNELWAQLGESYLRVLFQFLNMLISAGTGPQFFGFGFSHLTKHRVRVSSGLNILANFGFGFELSGLSGFTGLKFAK